MKHEHSSLLQRKDKGELVCYTRRTFLDSSNLLRLFIVVNLSGLTWAKLNYLCPSRYCQCASLPDRPDAVQIVCQPATIGKDYLDIAYIPGNFTTRLSIICKVDLIQSYLTNETFSHLTNLEELSISNCLIPTIPRNAFSGLKSLKHLNITREDLNPAPTHAEPGFLDGLDSLEVLRIPKSKIAKFPRGSLCTLRSLKYIEMALNKASVADAFKCDMDSNGSPLLPQAAYLNLNSNGIGEIAIDFKPNYTKYSDFGLGK